MRDTSLLSYREIQPRLGEMHTELMERLRIVLK